MVVKLVNGDTFIAELLRESDTNFIFDNPIAIKNIQVTSNGSVIEKTVTNPLCTLTHETEYSFDRSHVVYAKPLHPSLVDFYFRIVKAFEGESSVLANDLNEQFDNTDDDHEDDYFFVSPDKQQIH